MCHHNCHVSEQTPHGTYGKLRTAAQSGCQVERNYLLLVTVCESRSSLKLRISQCLDKMLSELLVYVTSTWCPGACPWGLNTGKICDGDRLLPLNVTHFSEAYQQTPQQRCPLEWAVQPSPPNPCWGSGRLPPEETPVHQMVCTAEPVGVVLAVAFKAQHAD